MGAGSEARQVDDGLPEGLTDGCELVEASAAVGSEQQVCNMKGSDGVELEAVTKVLEKLVRGSGVVGVHDIFALSELGMARLVKVLC